MENKKKILIVEDDASVQSIFKDKLEKDGFSVLEAKDGEEGLAVALREHPDLIILDILMPKMDGITVMKKLRQEGEWGKNILIIILTNVSEDDERVNQAITENEPAYYFVKSEWKIDDLVEKIKERISQKKF